MKFAWVVASILVAVACIAGCGEATAPANPVPVKPPPVAPCSLLTAREVAAALDVQIHVKRARFFCTYQGTRRHVFRSVVVSPQALTGTARPAQHETRYGQIVQVAGPGYRGQAQNDSPPTGASGLAQSNAQIISGEVVVRLLMTYQTTGLRGVPQLREVTTLADRVGQRLARSR